MNHNKPTITLRSWILHTTYGWLIGIFLIIVLSGLFEFSGITDMQFYLGVGMGTGIGLFQWFALHKHYHTSIQYVIYSILGLGIPYIIIDFFSTLSHEWNIILGFTIGGIFSSLLQTRCFPSSFLNAQKWVVYSTISWIISLGMLQISNYTYALKEYIPNTLVLACWNLFLMLAGGPILGYATGKLLPQYPTKNNQAKSE